MRKIALIITGIGIIVGTASMVATKGTEGKLCTLLNVVAFVLWHRDEQN